MNGMFNKISNHFCIWQLVIVIFSTGVFNKVTAQDSTFQRPPVTGTWKEYRRQMLHDSSKKMIELKSLIPGLVYDLRYATTNNFMKRLMYPSRTRVTFMRLPAARALQQVEQ
jgi:zinc D-Ala-D-Ala dipeptidase